MKWNLTRISHIRFTRREKLIKIGAKVVPHSRKIVFQVAELAVSRELFRAILEGIGRLRLFAQHVLPAHLGADLDFLADGERLDKARCQ